MEEHYNYVCETIFSYKDHREGVVRKAVIELMPTLANYNQNEFNAKYLHKCMAYLIGQVKKDKDRTTCGLVFAPSCGLDS
jgi:FKBP12-rapamycin complex-associated protein